MILMRQMLNQFIADNKDEIIKIIESLKVVQANFLINLYLRLFVTSQWVAYLQL